MAKTKVKKERETPLMKQYNAIKAKHPGALLLFRVGDFYETFGEDAITASKVLDIVLTKRANGAASHIELAGFPHHALDTYLPKLVRAGYRVAICDQLEDPKQVKGIVKRGVTELVTPGVTFNDNVLESRSNNYLSAVYLDKSQAGVVFLDISTGEFTGTVGSYDQIEKLIQSFDPSEILFSKGQKDVFHRFNKSDLRQDRHLFALDEWAFGWDFGYEKLIQQLGTTNLKGFGFQELPLAVQAAGAILHYLEITEHKDQLHISSISRIENDRYVWLDKFTIRNLELVRAQQDGGIPLIDILDSTLTAMGSRKLKKWMLLPLKDQVEIDHRLDTVGALTRDPDLLEVLRNQLAAISDLERLISKVAIGRINPRELVSLKCSLKSCLPIITALSQDDVPVFRQWIEEFDNCDNLTGQIEKLLRDDAPLLISQGKIIKEGVDPELDRLRAMAYSGKDYLLQLQQSEAARTGINSLKIGYNKVFGYYLEVTHAHKDKVPEEWIRKQTLVNAERYITSELKVYEEKILNAEDQLSVIELRLYNQLVEFAKDYVVAVQKNAQMIGSLDVLCAFAGTALKNKYSRPVINESLVLNIKLGRHPVIEHELPMGEAYIPNDVYLDTDTQQVMIITGPNMAGKSALLRQTALIVLMAQMGSYVPAEQAEIGLVDKVFTRVGASDNLAQGESTFMLEMIETASILNNLSDRSLILMDEIGRGTSTYDGVSIAWSIVEYLHNHLQTRAKTLFATHYHELNQLAETHERVKNYNVSVKEVGDRVIFMRKLKKGGSRHSFGIHVAQMAGMPNQVVIRANQILRHLEQEKLQDKKEALLKELPEQSYQLQLFESSPAFKKVTGLLGALDINTISPVEALLKLNELKMILEEGRNEL
ncbi:MAG: DNA mismatch repair protein MutS [Cyclobacteriaceae bacterium]|nr:MAG: DNA mismatch repair protein MutS [Cyclobacteriaceae bacterium]